jgi:crotonobetainyl-CoA:carnitine CoA-transferase CaiB-like acyl-CoA transferase
VSVPRGAPPLAGVRVVDVTTSYAGPVATMYLGDMGADVIKVERPVHGDDTRGWGPPFLGGESAWFLTANRNKRSVCIDLRSPEGMAVLGSLLESADVFIQSFNPVKLEGLGLAPEAICERFPRLVYCAMSGFGLDGPDRKLPGYDLVAQARSGMMSVTGESGRMPQRISTALSDVVAGTIAAFAIAAALRRQALTGEGDVIDVALLDADLSLMAPRIGSFLAGEPEPRPSGATDSVLAVYQPFETADRPIVVAVGNDEMWRRMCEVIGRPELAADPGLATNADRRERRAEVIEAIAERLRERPAAEWLAALARAAIPSAPIQFLSDVSADPQVRARRSIRTIDHPGAGEVEVVAAPWRLASDAGAPPTRPAPRLGADTVEVLAEAGYSEDRIAQLVEGGAVWSAHVPTS